MAESGRIDLTVTSQGGAVTGWIQWIESDINITDNTSKVTARLYYKNNGPVYDTYSTQSTIYLTVNGSTVSRTNGGTIPHGGGTWKALEHSVTVGHKNDDGTKSITISAGGALTGTVGLSASSGTGTAVLTTIPRSTVPGLPEKVDIGTTITIDLPRASASFTHDLSYKLGNGSYVSLASGVGDTYSWTVPMSLCSSLTSTASGTVTVKAVTKKGSDTIGTEETTMTVNVPSTVKPTAALSVTALNENTTVSGWGVNVKGYTKLRYAITGNVVNDYGATVTEYKFTAAGQTMSGDSGDTGVLLESGSVVASGQVKDSRGRWSDAATQTVTVYDYAEPQILNGSVFRCDSNGTASSVGTYLSILCHGSVSSVNSHNTMTCRYRTRVTGGTWSDYATLTDNVAETVNAGLSASSSYEVELSVADSLTATTRIYSVPTAALALNLKQGNDGVAFGVYATHSNEVEINENWGLRYRGSVMADHVVEQGTQIVATVTIKGKNETYQQTWTYRLWNSGVAECWGKFYTNLPSGGSKANGSVYLFNESELSFPTINGNSIFNAVPIAVTNIHAAGGLISAKTTNGTTASTLKYQVVRSNSGDDDYTYVVCHAFGTWK